MLLWMRKDLKNVTAKSSILATVRFWIWEEVALKEIVGAIDRI